MWNNNNNYSFNQSYTPRFEIIRVNGEAGARAINMAPNSSQFLADNTDSGRIWLVQTDGAGYLTVTPIDAAIHQEQPAPNINALEERIKHLEDMYEQLLNSRSNKSAKKQQSQSSGTSPTGEC